MRPVTQILERLTYQYLVGSQATRVYKFGPSILAGLVFAAGCIFLVLSLFWWLNSVWSSQLAALVTGLALIFIAALVLWYMDIRANRQLAQLQREHRELVTTAGDLCAESAQFGENIESFIQDSPKQSLLLAGLAGFLAADFLKR